MDVLSLSLIRLRKPCAERLLAALCPRDVHHSHNATQRHPKKSLDCFSIINETIEKKFISAAAESCLESAFRLSLSVFLPRSRVNSRADHKRRQITEAELLRKSSSEDGKQLVSKDEDVKKENDARLTGSFTLDGEIQHRSAHDISSF